jgi:hypothetical protein
MSIPNSVYFSFDEGGSKSSILIGILNLIISNENSRNILHVSTVDGSANLSISSFNLFEIGSNRAMTSDQVTFNGQALLSMKNVSASPQDVIVSVNRNDAGLFRGTLKIVSENSTFIPITIDVKPDFLKIAMLVVDGLALTVGIWNVTGYVFLDRKHEEIRQRIPEISASVKNIPEGQSQPQKQRDEKSVERIKSLLANSDPDRAYPEFLNLNHTYPRVKEVTSLESPNIDISHKKYNFSLREYTKPHIIEKNIVSGITAIAFGLIVGFIPLMQNDFINGLRALDFTDYLVLFLLGVGIGNLNEAISKIWETQKSP